MSNQLLKDRAREFVELPEESIADEVRSIQDQITLEREAAQKQERAKIADEVEIVFAAYVKRHGSVPKCTTDNCASYDGVATLIEKLRGKDLT